MGTLSSISFSAFDFNLGVKYPEIPTRFQSSKKTKSSCLLCGESIKRERVVGLKRLRWRCYSTSSNDDDGETSSSTTNKSKEDAEDHASLSSTVLSSLRFILLFRDFYK